MNPRYFEWNLDTGIVTEWVREGECNGCGQCCRAQVAYRLAKFSLPDPLPEYTAGRLGDNTSATGVWLEIRDETTRRFMSKPTIDLSFSQACIQLADNNQCTIHAFKNWKQQSLALCDVWPIHPDQVSPFSECSFTFVPGAQWRIEDIKRMTDLIVHTEGILGGRARINDTRLSVELIVECRQQGMTNQELMEAYDALTEESIKAALDYYAAHTSEIDASLEDKRSMYPNDAEGG